MDRRGVAAVLAADADLERRPGLAAALDPDAHQRADTLDVDRRERILLEDLPLLVDLQELSGVVPRIAERQLRHVVGAEGEELRVLGDLAGGQRAARYLDHRADQI